MASFLFFVLTVRRMVLRLFHQLSQSFVIQITVIHASTKYLDISMCMWSRIAQSLITVLVLVTVTASLTIVQVSAQGDHMQKGDSMNVTTTRNNQTSPLVYEILDSGVQVNLSWQPEAISTNETTVFTFEFIDSETQQHLQNVSYSVHMSLDGRSMGHAHEDSAPDGIGTVEQEFDSTGLLTIVVESTKVGIDTPIEGAAQFSVAVVPEFPLAPAIIMASALGSLIVGSRIVKTKKL
jgi:hypothetical protein